ncbi:histidine phosphatase family protein [Sulfurimonas sp. C5]|uniref:histidine phosphatase family protein n=1 Tax=Sulfurimonas sp. C5 TaxID=3036947 RepID=UPI002456B298|nr:histidine phosphatase family protein [Sulfurimonas sp. C5]MDH4944819.1 histidine phosphatase family protein [Sulfurimonas sp. C5]
MKLVLIRHSEVIEKYQGKYNGHIDIPLSKQGLEDAKALGNKLSSYNFDAIYCSDLKRCRQTLEQLNIPQKATFTNKLREKSWGRHEGLSFNEIEASGITYTTFHEWIEQLDGEEVSHFTQRVEEFFFEDLQKESLNTVLIITHSGVIKTLLGRTKNLDLEESFSIVLPYSSVTEILL